MLTWIITITTAFDLHLDGKHSAPSTCEQGPLWAGQGMPSLEWYSSSSIFIWFPSTPPSPWWSMQWHASGVTRGQCGGVNGRRFIGQRRSAYAVLLSFKNTHSVQTLCCISIMMLTHSHFSFSGLIWVWGGFVWFGLGVEREAWDVRLFEKKTSFGKKTTKCKPKLIL